MKVGVVGAGAAGLTAADALREKGHEVTIIETSSRAGGKCFSIHHDERCYELGAGVLSGNNQAALDLAKKYGVKVERVDFSTPNLFLDAQTGLPLPRPSIAEEFAVAYEALFRYRNLVRQFKPDAAGFAGVDGNLAEPFASWAEKHHIPHLAKKFAPFFTGYGYGFFDEIPAAYVLKYYSWELIKAFLKRQIYKFPDGIQHLWTAVADAHHVLYETRIENIERGQGIVVETDKGRLAFDKLIIAAPLDEALSYLDASSEERELFSKIRHEDYRTYACIVSSFPKQSGYAPGNYASSRKGHPVFWYVRHLDTDVYTFYVFGDQTISDDVAVRNIERLIKPLGGSIEQVLAKEHWKFFPHVDSQTMRDGYFDRLEALQGRKYTYYAGELLNFSTVGLSSEYSRKLVERFF